MKYLKRLFCRWHRKHQWVADQDIHTCKQCGAMVIFTLEVARSADRSVLDEIFNGNCLAAK